MASRLDGPIRKEIEAGEKDKEMTKREGQKRKNQGKKIKKKEGAELT